MWTVIDDGGLVGVFKTLADANAAKAALPRPEAGAVHHSVLGEVIDAPEREGLRRRLSERGVPCVRPPSRRQYDKACLLLEEVEAARTRGDFVMDRSLRHICDLAAEVSTVAEAGWVARCVGKVLASVFLITVGAGGTGGTGGTGERVDEGPVASNAAGLDDGVEAFLESTGPDTRLDDGVEAWPFQGLPADGDVMWGAFVKSTRPGRGGGVGGPGLPGSDFARTPSFRDDFRAGPRGTRFRAPASYLTALHSE